MVTFLQRKNCWLCCMLVLIPAYYAAAQQKTYHLQELAAAAKNQLPVIKQKQALLNSAKASLKETRHSFLPQFKISDQVNIGTDNSIAGSYLPIGAPPSASAGVRSDNIYQPATGNIALLYGEYDLVTFGLNKARLQSAESYIDLQQADLNREEYLLQAQVTRTYFNLLKAQYKLSADKQNVNRYDSVFKVIRALTASGIKAGSDSSLSKAELSKAKIIQNQSQGYLNQLKEEMGYLTGIPADQILIDSLARSFDDKKPILVLSAVDTTINPLLDYYAKRNNIFLSNAAVIRKSYLPKITLAASTWMRGSAIQYNDDYKSLASGLGYQRYNYLAGISMSYNLFNGLYKKDKLAINRYQSEAGNYELQQQQLALTLAGRKADNALLTNEENLAELPVQLQSAADTYRQKLAQYKAGLISLIDLTNASFVLYRSQTDFIETISDWYLAQLDKATATGNLLQFIQQIK